jgi:hypothetical protein
MKHVGFYSTAITTCVYVSVRYRIQKAIRNTNKLD